MMNSVLYLMHILRNLVGNPDNMPTIFNKLLKAIIVPLLEKIEQYEV